LSSHGLTPAQYRERYNLKSDYPMVARLVPSGAESLPRKSVLEEKFRGDADPSKPPNKQDLTTIAPLTFLAQPSSWIEMQEATAISKAIAADARASAALGRFWCWRPSERGGTSWRW
jgi:hypothetical protein